MRCLLFAFLTHVVKSLPYFLAQRVHTHLCIRLHWIQPELTLLYSYDAHESVLILVHSAKPLLLLNICEHSMPVIFDLFLQQPHMVTSVHDG